MTGSIVPSPTRGPRRRMVPRNAGCVTQRSVASWDWQKSRQVCRGRHRSLDGVVAGGRGPVWVARCQRQPSARLDGETVAPPAAVQEGEVT